MVLGGEIKRGLGLELHMKMIDFERHVVIRSKALAQARQQFWLIRGGHIARPEINGLTNVMKGTSSVLSINTSSEDQVHTGFLEYIFGGDDRQQDFRPQTGDTHSWL